MTDALESKGNAAVCSPFTEREKDPQRGKMQDSAPSVLERDTVTLGEEENIVGTSPCASTKVTYSVVSGRERSHSMSVTTVPVFKLGEGAARPVITTEP